MGWEVILTTPLLIHIPSRDVILPWASANALLG